MKKHCLLFFFLAIAAIGENAFAQTHKVSPPTRINYDERDLRYNPEWKAKEIYLEADLDGEPNKEVVICFIASYKPKPEANSEQKDRFDTARSVIPIVQNYAFTQIYHLDAGGHYQLAKTITGMDYPQNLRLLNLDAKHPQALAIISPGGENYNDVLVLRWQDGGYRTLLENAGNGNVDVLSDITPVTIRLGSRAWRWNIDKKKFEEIVWQM